MKENKVYYLINGMVTRLKITPYTTQAPLILGDFGLVIKDLPKLSDEEILAMQPASTQRSLKMSDEDHTRYLDAPIGARPLVAQEPLVSVKPVYGGIWPFKLLNPGFWPFKYLKGYMIGKGFVKASLYFKSRDWNFHKKARQNRDLSLFYRADRTPLIHPDNVNGIFSDCTPEEKKKISIDTFNHTNPDLVMQREYNKKEMSPAQLQSVLSKKKSWFVNMMERYLR